MLRILLADDHAVVRQGVKQILAETFARANFGEAQNAHELLELVASERWDIVVLDLTMPGGNGLEALKQIKHDHPQLPVLILSMYPEDQYAVRTIRAGAAGYLNKESAPEELVQAIRKVLQGGEYISASVADELVLHTRHEDGQPLHRRSGGRRAAAGGARRWADRDAPDRSPAVHVTRRDGGSGREHADLFHSTGNGRAFHHGGWHLVLRA